MMFCWISARQVNARLDHARQAYSDRDYEGVRAAITGARDIVQRITCSQARAAYKLNEIKTRKRVLPQAQVTDLRTVKVGGYPASTFDYQFYEDWRKGTLYGREISQVLQPATAVFHGAVEALLIPSPHPGLGQDLFPG